MDRLVNLGPKLVLCAVIDGKLVKVIKYSKAFKEKWDFLKAKGYEPTTATIRFILVWKGKDDENATAIILPDLCLNKIFSKSGQN